MAKIQINDVKLDGAELFNDSETFLSELQDGEMEQIVGGLTIAEDPVASIYYPDEPVHPVEPLIHPWKPVHPQRPIHPKKPIRFPHPYTPVIL